MALSDEAQGADVDVDVSCWHCSEQGAEKMRASSSSHHRVHGLRRGTGCVRRERLWTHLIGVASGEELEQGVASSSEGGEDMDTFCIRRGIRL